jgi:hypothetical protein
VKEKPILKIFAKLEQPIVLSFNVQVLHNTLESLTLSRSPTKMSINVLLQSTTLCHDVVTPDFVIKITFFCYLEVLQ